MGKGSSKGHTPREAKDNLKSTQLLSVIDAISEGPVEGPVDGLKSVLLNSTPVLDSEGNTNISGVTVVFRAGEQEQTPPEGFESSGSETVLGTEVKYDTPITRTITSANIDRLRFTFGVQALVETTSKGDRNPSEVRLLVQIQRNGGWVTEKDITIKGKTTSQYLASVVVDNLPPRPFNIRMRRIAASINIKPGHDYYFYVRSVNTVGKSAFVEAVGQPSDDASGYLDFFKGEIGKTHLAQELWTQIDNGQLAPDLTEIRTSITDVSNEITQTVNKKLEDQSAAIQQIQKVQVDTNNNLNSMWAVKLQQMQDGRLYIAGIGAGIENTPDGMQSQVLLAADRIAMINPANGNTKPMFVGQGDQIFMNEVFLKRLTAPTITSGGNPPAFSLTSDGRLTAKNADISGSVNANSGTLNNVTINQNCTIKGMLEATQVRGDFVKAVSKAFPKKVGTWGNTETPNGTVTVTISDDHNFDRQIIIPPIIFNGIAYDDPGSGNNPGGTRYTGYGFEVRKNGVLIASRETKGAIPGSYSAVIDMPSGRGSVTLEFKIFQKGNQGAGNITDCTVIVTKKAASGISIR
ncbi:DUF1983 domain-containing protein [Escherichia coli]|nr:DUF1983 domain-containing protein [Escherichia coli]MED0501236.1 DUF1983 domain-containing protein [Escherichia coli]